MLDMRRLSFILCFRPRVRQHAVIARVILAPLEGGVLEANRAHDRTVSDRSVALRFVRDPTPTGRVRSLAHQPDPIHVHVIARKRIARVHPRTEGLSRAASLRARALGV